MPYLQKASRQSRHAVGIGKNSIPFTPRSDREKLHLGISVVELNHSDDLLAVIRHHLE